MFTNLFSIYQYLLLDHQNFNLSSINSINFNSNFSNWGWRLGVGGDIKYEKQMFRIKKERRRKIFNEMKYETRLKF